MASSIESGFGVYPCGHQRSLENTKYNNKLPGGRCRTCQQVHERKSQAKRRNANMMNSNIRRDRLDLMSAPERAIFDVCALVEAEGCDARLTEAINLLKAAREKVADYIDEGRDDG